MGQTNNAKSWDPIGLAEAVRRLMWQPRPTDNCAFTCMSCGSLLAFKLHHIGQATWPEHHYIGCWAMGALGLRGTKQPMTASDQKQRKTSCGYEQQMQTTRPAPEKPHSSLSECHCGKPGHCERHFGALAYNGRGATKAPAPPQATKSAVMEAMEVFGRTIKAANLCVGVGCFNPSTQAIAGLSVCGPCSSKLLSGTEPVFHYDKRGQS